MRIELKPRKKDTAPELTPQQIEALKKEKAELLAGLAAPRKRPAVLPVVKDPVVEPVPEPEQHEVLPVLQGQEALDAAAAVAVRKELESRLKDLEQQIVAAKLREKQAQQASIIASQAQAQAQGSKQLAPLQPLLQRHLAEVVRIQTKWGPTLKDMARSMASDSDSQVRIKVSAVYRAAAPLAQKVGEARATLESAIRGLSLALQSSHAHVHAQAKTLGDAALQINTLSLESECKSLVQLRNELRPGYQVQSTTADHIVAPSLAPHPHVVSVDFGPSLT